MNLPQEGRNDEKHLLMMSMILPKYLEGLLATIHITQNFKPRDLIKEIKLLISFKKDKFVWNAMQRLSLTFSDLIPLEKLLSSQFPIISQYASKSLISTLE